MARIPVEIRAASPDDAEALVRLWADATEGQPMRLAEPGSTEAQRAIERSAVDPQESLQVAVVDGEIVGLAHLTRAPVSPLHEEDAVRVTHFYVSPGLRRRGVGRALLGQAAAWAEEKDSTQLLAAVAAGSRDANRFLACLGLTQVLMVRAVPVAVLRQRLAAAEAEHVDTPALLARRRTVLRRQISARGVRRLSTRR